MVGGRETPVEITADTVIGGQPIVGALVWVVAMQQGRPWSFAAEVLAANTETPPFEFEG